jgi:hypothetical protein
MEPLSLTCVAMPLRRLWLGTNPLKSLLTWPSPGAQSHPDQPGHHEAEIWKLKAALRQHGAHEDHAGGMEVGVSHAQHHQTAAARFLLVSLVELSFFSLVFPLSWPVSNLSLSLSTEPAGYRQPFAGIQLRLRVFVLTCLVHIQFHQVTEPLQSWQQIGRKRSWLTQNE